MYAFSKSNTQERTTTNNSDNNSYYSDDEEREETYMMKVRMKCHKPPEKNEVKKDKPQSCTIIASVKTMDGRRNCLVLVDTISLATLANEEIVQECLGNETKQEVEWTTQGGLFNTTRTAIIHDLKLPQFTRNRTVEHKMHLFKKINQIITNLFLGEISCKQLD